MPHGAPPPGPAPAADVTRFPDESTASQVGVLEIALAAGASTPIPGVREDFGIVEAVIGTDVAALLALDYVPIRTPASSSLYLPFGEPVITGQTHEVTNNSGATVNVSLYVVAKRRTSNNGHHQAQDNSSQADQG